MIFRILPSWLEGFVFRSFESKEVFLSKLDEIRQKNPNRPIAFVLMNAGVVEYWAITLFLRERYGSSWELRLATRISALFVEAPGLVLKRVAAFFRLAPRPPSRLLLCSEELHSGRPILLNFDVDRKSVTEIPKGERELAYLAQRHPDLLVLPTVFVWRRARRMETGPKTLIDTVVAPITSPWYLLLGDPSQPTGLRKLAIMVRQYARSTLTIGEPLPITEYSAKTLRRRVLMAIQGEKRVILGPSFRSTKLVGETILRHATFKRFLEGVAVETGEPEAALVKKSESIFRELAAQFSYFSIELIAWFLNQVFHRIFEDITLNEDEIEGLRVASREGTLLLIPCHRSYVDFLLLSYVMFRKGIYPPHIIAGINLNFWPVGGIFKRGGAIFIRRSFRGDVLYSEVLRRYLAALLSSHVNLEFFIEGQRSRSGKLAPPKYGILKMIVDGHYDGLITEKVRVVPVSLTYDLVTESRSHKRELEGGEKVPETAMGVVRSTKVLLKKFGKVHVRFGNVIPLEGFLEEQVGKDGGMSQDLRKMGIQKLAFEVCHRINRVTPITPEGLMCAVVLSHPGSSVPVVDLEAVSPRFARDLKLMGTPISPDLEKDFVETCRRGSRRMMADGVFEEYQTASKGPGLRVPQRQRVAALYYKNTVIHAFLNLAVAGIAGQDRDELLELRQLLQFEFFFAGKEEFLEQVLAIDPGIDVAFYAPFLGDVFETIELGLRGLIEMNSLTLDQKEWKSRLLKLGKAAILENSIRRFEAVNTTGINAFITQAINQEWLKPVSHREGLYSPTTNAELRSAHARVKYFMAKSQRNGQAL